VGIGQLLLESGDALAQALVFDLDELDWFLADGRAS